jgi:cyclase
MMQQTILQRTPTLYGSLSERGGAAPDSHSLALPSRFRRRFQYPLSRLGCCLIVIFVGLVFWTEPTFSQAPDFDIVPVSKGVYAVIGKNGAYSNGAFIVNEQDVIVVDTQLRPSWAREVISEIKKITDKPVRYVINTHWHRDHVQGNQEYLAAFPGVIIIQHVLSREDQIENQPTEMVTRAPKEIARLKKVLDDNKDEKGNALSADTRVALHHMLDLQIAYAAEIPTIQLVPGTLTFSHTMTIHEPDREIDLDYFGYAHTRGDVVVYLPTEKIIIAGDLLESGIPLMRTAYPVKLLGALESVQKLNWDYAIPGHGTIQHGRETIHELINYERDLITGVKDAVARGMSEGEAVKSVNLGKYDKSPDFKDRNNEAIQRAYLEITGKLPN